MKTLSIICIGALALGLVTGEVFGQASYCKDYLENGNPGGTAGLKTFEEEAPYTPGSLFIDIWVCDLRPDPIGLGNESLISGGFKIVYDPTITVVDVTMYTNLTGGPWDFTASTVEGFPADNKIQVKLSQVAGVISDGENDVILAKLEVQGTGTITVSTIPSPFATVVSKSDGYVYDDDHPPDLGIGPNVFTVGGCTVDADCTDVLFCNGEETCVGGFCQPGVNPCPGQICNEGSDICEVPCTIDADCIDALFCNGDETCAGGVCQAGADPCAPQVCDEGTDTCEDCFIDADCDDGEFCNGDETCAGGVCQAGTDPCTPQFCDEGTDTCEDCFIDAHCDDGEFCNGDETCAGGVCQAGSDPCPGQSCNEGSDICVVPCTVDADCIDALFCNGEETCVGGFCQPGVNPCPGQICNEGSDICEPPVSTTTTTTGGGGGGACTTDTQCDDDNVCTDDTCESESCNNTPVTDGTACDDDLYCTATDTCEGGICEGTGSPCTGSNTCDEETQSCDCTEDADCDDEVFCNGAETCDPDAGCRPGSNPCTDDGTFCNGDESCDEEADQCVSSGDPCPQGQECNEADALCETSVGIEASTPAVGLVFFVRAGVVTIQGMGTDFTQSGSVVTYDSLLVFKGLREVNTSTQTIRQGILLWPSILFPALSYPATVEVCVDGFCDDMDIGSLF